MLPRFWLHRDTGLSQPVCETRQCGSIQELMKFGRVDRLVQLAGASYRRALCRLSYGGNDPCMRVHFQSGIRSSKLAGLATHNVDSAHTWMYQQHAHEVDRQFQFYWIDLQYRCAMYSSYPHPRGDKQRVTRSPSLYPCKCCVEQLL